MQAIKPWGLAATIDVSDSAALRERCSFELLTLTFALPASRPNSVHLQGHEYWPMTTPSRLSYKNISVKNLL